MRRAILKSKIHRARVTEANLNYEGSITIDKALMEAANIANFEKVSIWNIENGERFETYAVEGERDSGEICLNGAAARLVHVGDRVIIASFCELEEHEIAKHNPKLVLVDESTNRIKAILGEIKGAG